MIALMVVVIDKLSNTVFQFTGELIIFQQNLILQRSMQALDFTLSLRMKWFATCVTHILIFKIMGQLTRYITGAIVP